MFTAIFLSIVGIGLICWLPFTLAVYALPFFAAISAGMLAYDTGAGPVGATAVALMAGAFALLVGQMLSATIRTPWVRALIAAAYAAPAAIAGYHAVHGLSAIGGTTEPWRVAFSIGGSIVIGIVAWTRISAFHPAGTRRGIGGSNTESAQSGRAIHGR